jgi:RNA polymerase sigma-70 factor (ECF subfamily)
MVSDAAPLCLLGMSVTAGSAEDSLRPLVERAQAGDLDAFDRLVEGCQRRVVATAWRLLGNQDDALDAAQDVFFRLHRYLRSFKTDQDFHAWLYRLTVNACHDARRKRSNHLSLDHEKERGALEALRSDDDVEATASLRQDEALILKALDTLSEKERAALVLRDIEGLETEDVARALGSSPTTVRSQISTARAKLRQFRERFLETTPKGRA